MINPIPINHSSLFDQNVLRKVIKIMTSGRMGSDQKMFVICFVGESSFLLENRSHSSALCFAEIKVFVRAGERRVRYDSRARNNEGYFWNVEMMLWESAIHSPYARFLSHNLINFCA